MSQKLAMLKNIEAELLQYAAELEKENDGLAKRSAHAEQSIE